jgi:hypothetical protein
MYQQHELNRQKEEFEEQKKQQERQQFENTYFNMLNLLNEIVKSLVTEDGQGQVTFRIYKKDRLGIKYKLGDVKDILYANASREQRVGIMTLVINALHLEQYFRIIYTTLKLIEESKLVYKDKKRYSNILRAQLSNDELFFLGYNCIMDDCDFLPFKMLLEKYTFLKHLPTDERVSLIQQDNDDDISFYHLRAFDKTHKFSKDYLEKVDNNFKELGIDDFIDYEEIQ